MSNEAASGEQQPWQKIFLIGYRACGKSAVGRQLAAELDWRYLDCDRELSRRAGCSISDLVAHAGWEEFRARERQLLSELLPRRELVVATGGGAVLHQELWPALRRSGLVVWLTAEPATITRRLAADPLSQSQRPALTEQGLLAEITTVLDQRQPLYQQAAHLRIATDQLAPPAIVEEIIAHLTATAADDI
ncbi:MAG: shikimate kinase [Desulfurivibrio sp.]|nr:shikimate kinase [Desulfurivibrio sp.]